MCTRRQPVPSARSASQNCRYAHVQKNVRSISAVAFGEYNMKKRDEPPASRPSSPARRLNITDAIRQISSTVPKPARADGSRAAACVTGKPGRGIVRKQVGRRGHQPVRQRRLADERRLQELRHQPVAGQPHVAGALGDEGLMVPQAGPAPERPQRPGQCEQQHGHVGQTRRSLRPHEMSRMHFGLQNGWLHVVSPNFGRQSLTGGRSC